MLAIQPFSSQALRTLFIQTTYAPEAGVQNYDISYYDDAETQSEILCEWLKEIKALGYRPDEITVLSFRTDRASAAEKLIREGYNLRPAWQNSKAVAYASIHAFKGMENKVIILTDIVLGYQDFHRDLFYTGITRGTEIVRILCDAVSQKILIGWLSDGVD